MPRIHSHVPESTSPYGNVGQHAIYLRAAALYERDRLEEAFKAMLELGAGASGEAIPTYRMIEAEYLTRQQAKVREISPSLRVEVVASAVDEAAIAEVLKVARTEASERLAINWDSIVHATVLDEAANAPWAPGRHGYCSFKSGFAKICLPYYLTQDKVELAAAFRHELVHALIYQEAEHACATWLHEAAAMQIGGEPIDEAHAYFTHHKQAWIDPLGLSVAFRRPRITQKEQQSATMAYWQAAVIGNHIAAQYGEEMLGKAIKAHRLGFLDQLRASFQGRETTEIAVSKTLGMGVSELFARARPQ